jgi:hypothetical protein
MSIAGQRPIPRDLHQERCGTLQTRNVIRGYGYTAARTDTTQQSGQTPAKEVEIKNSTVYVSGYTETDSTVMLSPTTVWRFSVAANINSNVFDFYFLIWSLSRLLCCVGSGLNVAAARDWSPTKDKTHGSFIYG